MFKSNFLEALTKVHPVTPLVIFVPVVIWYFYKQVQLGWAPSLFLAGLLFWTFFEYTLHRFLFHWVPENKIGRYLHFLFHGIHHDYPRDSRRLVMPPTVGIALSSALYFIFLQILTPLWVSGFFSGFMFGYLCYDMIHFAVHHFNLKASWFVNLRNNHFIHHYSDSTSNFGVSSPLWDFIFRTFAFTCSQKISKTEVS